MSASPNSLETVDSYEIFQSLDKGSVRVITTQTDTPLT